MKHTFRYNGFTMVLDTTTNIVDIWHGNECREYKIPTPITNVVHEKEYVYITVENTDVYQFKFEQGAFLVGDIIDRDGEFKDAFACHVYGE